MALEKVVIPSEPVGLQTGGTGVISWKTKSRIQNLFTLQSISFRFILSITGVILVSAAGGLALGISFSESLKQIDRMSSQIRAETMMSLANQILSLTNSVQETSLLGAKGPLLHSDYGCCSQTSDDAKLVNGEKFREIREYHWQNLISHPSIGLSASMTSASGTLLYSRSLNMADVDGSGARQGLGNLVWTLADASTGFRYFYYTSNSFGNGQYVKAPRSACAADQFSNSYADPHLTLNSKADCDNAALVLSNQSSVQIMIPTAQQGCYFNSSSNVVFWNPIGLQNIQDPTISSFCKEGSWMRRTQVFMPNCSNQWPCNKGVFISQADPDFNSSLWSRDSAPYNVSTRTWFQDALKNTDPLGLRCRQIGFEKCRSQPSWGRVYVSLALKKFVLPSVFPIWSGNKTMNSVILLGVPLDFLDSYLQRAVAAISPDATGWIVDLNPASNGKDGTLIASYPGGLAATLTTNGSTVSMTPTLATSATTGGPQGQDIETMSQTILAQFASWQDVPDNFQLTINDRFIQTQHIQDSYGLQWLLILAVPQQVFLGDLPKTRQFTIGIVVGLTLLAALLIFVLTCVVSQHIMKLAADMALVANMDMSGCNSNVKSRLSEIAQMNQSFRQMSNNLKTLWDAEQARLQLLQQEHVMELQRKLHAAMESVHKLGYPMVLMSATTFRNLSEAELALMHEGNRDAGRLKILDTMAQIQDFKDNGNKIIFITYEWLSWQKCGPSSIQYSSMMSAIDKLREMHADPEHKLWVWFDILSIPQTHPTVKALAVYSLYTYAGQSDYHIINAPDDMHQGKHEIADLATVQKRVWTRAEMLFHVAFNGLNCFWSFQGHGSLNALSFDWWTGIAHVFDAEMTCCRLKHPLGQRCDKETLVQPLLGLYYDMYSKARRGSLKSHLTAVWKHISDNKRTIFPEHFEYSTNEGNIIRELFGPLIQQIEDHVDGQSVFKSVLIDFDDSSEVATTRM